MEREKEARLKAEKEKKTALKLAETRDGHADRLLEFINTKVTSHARAHMYARTRTHACAQGTDAAGHADRSCAVTASPIAPCDVLATACSCNNAERQAGTHACTLINDGTKHACSLTTQL